MGGVYPAKHGASSDSNMERCLQFTTEKMSTHERNINGCKVAYAVLYSTQTAVPPINLRSSFSAMCAMNFILPGHVILAKSIREGITGPQRCTV